MAGRFALIIAADQYSDEKLSQLRAPAHDANELESVLADSEIGAFEVRLVINESAQHVRDEVERFFSSREPEDLLLLYFACHGVKDRRNRLYFAMSDTRLDLLASRGIASHFVNEQSEACRSRRIVLILDCCYSGAYARGLAPRGDTRVGVCERFEGEGRVVLTASDALEYAFEEDELKAEMGHSSIFTGAIIRGLRTGDADLDQDGMVSVDDLYKFTYREVRARTPNQTPGKVDMVSGSIYLAANPRIETPPIPSPADPFLAVMSERRWEREEAVLELRMLTEDTDATLAQAARASLERLSIDRERLVRASALAALGDVTRSHFERGLVLASSGDIEGADAEFQKVTESSMTELSGFAHFNRGILATAVKKAEDAARHYTAAIRAGQPLPAARAALNLGCLEEAAGRPKTAMSLYQAAMSYGDTAVEPRAAFLLGRLHEERGELSTAWLSYATASDYDGYPFAAAAKSRYQALIRSANRRDILTRVLSLSGYPDPAAPLNFGE
jgi:Caspase domain